ncbi:MAG: restriction endonuclease [Clostridiales Family XIII bacterium]|jgi:hypothetical protein|nr:restriction endonuclease [Clostridiales Family XIII bacterium]
MDMVREFEILEKAKVFFRERIAAKHLDNTLKLKNIDAFNINPFTQKYLAQFAFGNSDPESMARVILYPRILGTSISTTFGNELQFFCNEVLSSFASTTSGIDIEYTDAVDERRKYCQVKAGPTTINNDDVATIENHFTAIKNLARTNRLTDFNPLFDCVVGVLYGDESSLSASYKKIAKNYTVLAGQDFWEHLTGDPLFYGKLINAFAEVADEMDSSEIIEEVVKKLSEQIAGQLPHGYEDADR